MNRKHLVLLALAVLCLLGVLQAGCAGYPTEAPTRQRMTAPINTAISKVSVSVRWHDSVDSVNSTCGIAKAGQLSFTYGCATPFGKGGCVIEALRPRDWSDLVAFEILGHEIAHCFLMAHD